MTHLAGRRIAALLATTAIAAALSASVPQTSASAHFAAPVSDPCLEPVAEDHAGEPHEGAAAREGHGHDHAELSEADRSFARQSTARRLRERGLSPAGAVALTSEVTVPVYVHVMRDANGAGDVSESVIDEQIAVLNKTFAGQESSLASDTGFRFTLAGVDRWDNATWHRDGESTTYRTKTRKGGANALNIWLLDLDGAGVATWPWEYATKGAYDGIRVDHTTVPGGSMPGFNLGETATHEAGHWLGLLHTFQGGCRGGDEVADTPAQKSSSSGCPIGRDSCNAPGDDPIHNYMDYSHDTCYNQFTDGQSARMATMWQAHRAS